MDPNYRTPVTEEFNGGYTWAINDKSVIEAEYIHVLSLHENKTINLDPKIPVNRAQINSTATTEDAGGNPICSPDPTKGCGFFQPLDASFIAAGVPKLGSLRDEQSIGRSRYDALNFSYRQRAFHKTDLIANYTLARAVGYNEDGGSFRYYPRDPQNPLAPNEFGPAFNDERNHITLAATAHLPWGLEFSPILQAGSARPYNPIASVNELNFGGGSDPGAVVVPKNDQSNLTAFVVTDPITGDTSVDKVAASQCYYSGNCVVAPYNSKRGNAFFNMDARVAKNIKVGEGRNLQLIFQAFNLTNHANYGNDFGTVVDSSSFGNPVGFMNPTSSLLPRAFTGEFGARFTF
jgi:hypothetical protein